MTIEEVLIAKIIALATTAGDRIYRDVIEEEPTLPAIAITRTGGAAGVRVASGAPGIEVARLTVGIVSFTSAGSLAVADKLKEKDSNLRPLGLDGWSTQGNAPVAGQLVVLSCQLQSQHELPEVDGDHRLRVILQDYEIKFR